MYTIIIFTVVHTILQILFVEKNERKKIDNILETIVTKLTNKNNLHSSKHVTAIVKCRRSLYVDINIL